MWDAWDGGYAGKGAWGFGNGAWDAGWYPDSWTLGKGAWGVGKGAMMSAGKGAKATWFGDGGSATWDTWIGDSSGMLAYEGANAQWGNSKGSGMNLYDFDANVSEITSPNDFAKPSNQVSSGQAKICMCKFFEEGRCTQGANCKFAHSLKQLGSSAPFICRGRAKTAMCKFFEEGKCRSGAACTFAHSVEELGQKRSPGSSRSGSRRRRRSTSSSRVRKELRRRKRKQKHKRRSSSSSSSSSKHSKKKASEEQEKDRIEKIANAARVNRIKKRRQEAREALATNAKASEPTTVSTIDGEDNALPSAIDLE